LKIKANLAIGLFLILILINVGCLSEAQVETTPTPEGSVSTPPPEHFPESPKPTAPTATEAPGEEADEEHIHSEPEHHGVPHEFIDMVNPVAADSASILRGSELYSSNCANCHGIEGKGDGTMAMTLEPKPTNLHEHHVQEETDGSLFYMISEGVEGTSMAAFKASLLDEERWHIVNYLRTFEIEEGEADDHEDGDHAH
jgi:cytochrome c553